MKPSSAGSSAHVRNKLAWSIAAAITFSAGATSIAIAQEEEEGAEALEEITVTGSRIRRDDFSNPQPTTVVGSELLDNLGIVNLGDAMASLPSNVGNNTPTANPGGNFFNGSNIANLRGLNPFFGSRTLTLVDSRRHVPTNQGDGVDLNFIPSILIDRMEVVTGGASASYGSGAIGGVTNILLDRDLEGGKAQVDLGTTAENDGDDFHYGFAWGSAIGDAGHVVVGVEGQDMDAILYCAQARDWCARGASIQTNQPYATTPDPNFVYVEGATTVNVNRNGVFPGNRLTFTDGSGTTLRPYEAAGAYTVGGEGRHIYEYASLRSNVDRQTFYGIFTWEFSESLNMFVEGSLGSVETFSPQNTTANNQFIQPDNYYLNNLPVNPCAGLAPAPCFYNVDLEDQSNTANQTETDLERWAVGFNGAIGDTTWTWDAYYQYGESDRNQNVLDNPHAERWNFARDVVPSIPGDYSSTPVCRITRDGPNPTSLIDPRLGAGCVPVNLFGDNLTPEGYDYIFGQLLENTTVEQDIIEVVTSGELFQGFGAGPVRAAFGFSWRDESILNQADPSQPDYIRTDYLVQYGETFGGDVEVYEYFTEVDVPITDSLGLVGAVRRSLYTNTGGVGTGRAEGQEFDYGITTWKVNANWQVNDTVALRVSQSRDIRAPNFRELYYGQVIPSGSPFGFCSNEWTGNISLGAFTNTGDACVLDLHGGLGLQPEEADTTTVGFILTPQDWNVRFAADWYQIEISDAITPASSALVLEGCFDARDPVFCSQITGELLDPNDPLGGFSDIHVVSPEAFNFRSYKSRGIDITADWAGEFDFGTLSSRLIASRVLEQSIQPNTTSGLTRDIAGVVGSTGGFLADWASAPDWTAQWITTWFRAPFTVTTQARWVKEGDIYADRFGPGDSNYNPNTINSISDNALPNYVVWTLSGSYDFVVADVELSAFGTVNNLFDKDPPLAGVGVGGASATFYDTIGRSYRVGLRATF